VGALRGWWRSSAFIGEANPSVGGEAVPIGIHYPVGSWREFIDGSEVGVGTVSVSALSFDVGNIPEVDCVVSWGILLE
jgi:hypothetical protein